MLNKLQMRLTSDEGFTLIETPRRHHHHRILLAIAIPRTSSSRIGAKNAAAQANVRAAVPGMEAYAADHNGSAYSGATSALLQVRLSPGIKNIRDEDQPRHVLHRLDRRQLQPRIKAGPGAPITSVPRPEHPPSLDCGNGARHQQEERTRVRLHRKGSRRDEGFTLIELLVVIIIIRSPSCHCDPRPEFKDRANNAAAQANVCAAVPGIEAYAADHNGSPSPVRRRRCSRPP